MPNHRGVLTPYAKSQRVVEPCVMWRTSVKGGPNLLKEAGVEGQGALIRRPIKPTPSELWRGLPQPDDPASGPGQPATQSQLGSKAFIA